MAARRNEARRREAAAAAAAAGGDAAALAAAARGAGGNSGLRERMRHAALGEHSDVPQTHVRWYPRDYPGLPQGLPLYPAVS